MKVACFEEELFGAFNFTFLQLPTSIVVQASFQEMKGGPRTRSTNFDALEEVIISFRVTVLFSQDVGIVVV